MSDARQSPDPRSDPFHRPWLTILLGLVIVVYAGWWTAHPSTMGFESGFGLLGRLLKWCDRELGRWPVGIFFALSGLSVFSIGVVGVVRRR
jgi:hypothetical protein